MIKKLGLLLIPIFVVCTISCNSDKDSDDLNYDKSSLTINGVNIGKIIYTLSEVSKSPNELVFEAHFDFCEEGIISFNLAIPSINEFSKLKKGEELVNELIIYKFYPMNAIFTGYKNYEVLDGSVKVSKMNDSSITLNFNNFKFLRELGDKEEHFNVSGAISYSIND